MSTSANQAANDIKTHESIRKIYSCCLVILLLLLATVALVSYILGEESLPSLELVSSKSLAAVIYMAIIACALFLNERAIRNSKKYANLQKELDESERKNSELDNALLESERKLEEAKALAERYWKMLSDAQRATEESLKIANSNRVQHTSGDTSGC